MRQENKPGGRAVAFERVVEALALDRERAGIVVGLAMNKEQWVFDFVGVVEGRHRGVDFRRLPDCAFLGLKTEGREGAVVSAAASKAGAEEIGVREEICGHERAVAVAADSDARAIGDAAPHEFVDGSLGAGDELFNIGVVGLDLALADDGHRGIVEHGVAREQEGQWAVRTHTDEAIGRVLQLTGGVGAFELLRISPEQRGQRTIGNFVAGWQIKCAGKRDAVSALVLNQLLANAGESGIRVRKIRDRCEGVAREIAQEIIGRSGDRFARGEDAVERVVGEGDEALVVGRGRAPEAAGGLGCEGERVEKRPVSLRRSAGAIKIHLGTVSAQQEAEAAEAIAHEDGHSGIFVAIFGRAFEEQSGRGAGCARRGEPRADRAGLPPVFVDEGVLIIAPRDGAGHTEREAMVERGFCGERCGEREPCVAQVGDFTSVATVEGFEPAQGRGRIGAPRDRAWAGADGTRRNRDTLSEREIGDGVDDGAGAIKDGNFRGETIRRDEIRIRTMKDACEKEAAIRRG